jgi:anti-sigma factor RsiW
MNLIATHPFAAEELMAFCDGELSTEESQTVEDHLAECRDCAYKVRQFRETSQSLREWNAPPVSQRMEEAVEEQLQATDSGRGGSGSMARFGRQSRPRWRPWMIGGASAVAAFLLIAVVGISVAHYLHQPGPAPNLPATSASVEELATSEPSRASVGGSPQPSPSPDAAEGTQSPAQLIARSVTFVIVARDVANARPALDAILAKYRGYASEIDVNTPADDAPSLKASLRIPVANLDAAMKDLRGLGRVASESESGEDVTQQHADLDQRLKTARDTEERFRTILQQRTGTVSDVLQVEEEIARVRGDIESMEAEQTNLEHRVDFASIDLSMTENYGPVAGSAPLSVRLHNAFVAGYRNAAGTVVGIFLFLVAYGLTILIWIAILGVPVVLLRRRYRRMRAKL